MRNSRGGGVGFTLTDDRRVFAGPPKPPFLLLRSRLDSPLLINGALLRHDVPVMFIGCSVVTELFGCTFTDRSEGVKKKKKKERKRNSLRFTRTAGHRRPYLSHRSCSLKGPFYSRRRRVRAGQGGSPLRC